ncbi:hypothetical protein [Variovorax sp. GT1P44]|uniref:hypothetical protein n=1 Tax=Variovorax sp. GT1P44 TaxID=3443742 RepID=UPI003F47779E
MNSWLIRTDPRHSLPRAVITQAARATESRSLLGFLDAEIERRIQLVKGTISSLMQSPQ